MKPINMGLEKELILSDIMFTSQLAILTESEEPRNLQPRNHKDKHENKHKMRHTGKIYIANNK